MRTLSGRVYAERNQLLAALPDDEYARLLPHIQVVMLEAGEVLYEPGAKIAHAYFPQRAALSVITVLSDGAQVESASIGFEGMAGIPLFLGVDTSASKIIVQVAETATRIEAKAFRMLLGRSSVLTRLLKRYTQLCLDSTAQTVACGRLHSLEERCARWLLETHDRVGRDSFRLTQAFLATMLGVHRPAVTLAAGALARAGLISYQRGQMTVVDRAGLEDASCECQRAIDGYYREIVGLPLDRTAIRARARQTDDSGGGGVTARADRETA